MRLTLHPLPRADANLFREAFIKAQDANKSLLSGNAAPAPAASDAPVAADATTTTSTGAPVEKGKEAAPAPDAAEDAPPAYKDEGVAPPPEKTEVVQGEEVKEPTAEVRSLPACAPGRLLARRLTRPPRSARLRRTRTPRPRSRRPRLRPRRLRKWEKERVSPAFCLRSRSRRGFVRFASSRPT